jgi:hypothetical protein
MTVDCDASFKVRVDLKATNSWTQTYKLFVRDDNGVTLPNANNTGTWIVAKGVIATWSSSIDTTYSGNNPEDHLTSIAQLKITENGDGDGELGWDANQNSPDGYSYRRTKLGHY